MSSLIGQLLWMLLVIRTSLYKTVAICIHSMRIFPVRILDQWGFFNEDLDQRVTTSTSSSTSLQHISRWIFCFYCVCIFISDIVIILDLLRAFSFLMEGSLDGGFYCVLWVCNECLKLGYLNDLWAPCVGVTQVLAIAQFPPFSSPLPYPSCSFSKCCVVWCLLLLLVPVFITVPIWFLQ